MKHKVKHRSRGWAARLVAASGIAAGCLILVSYGTLSPDGGLQELDQARTTLDKWVETRRLISMEKRDWALGRELLLQRIRLVERELESLRERVTGAEAGIAEADRGGRALLERNERFKAADRTLEAVVEDLEQRTMQLLARVPDPLRERLKPISRRLPQPEGEARLSLAERFQSLMVLLGEIDKFNQVLTLVSEVRTLEVGQAIEVDTLYVGLGQAYYVTANGLHAGVGRVTTAGWEWRSLDATAPRIRAAIAILRNEQPADFIRLPIDLHDRASGGSR